MLWLTPIFLIPLPFLPILFLIFPLNGFIGGRLLFEFPPRSPIPPLEFAAIFFISLRLCGMAWCGV